MAILIPKQRLLRAIDKAGLATPQQIAIIDRKITHDRDTQVEFQKMYRMRRGNQFSKGMSSFVQWVIKHWDEIKFALGIVALFLDEEEGTKDEVEATVEDTVDDVYTAPPAPKKDKVPDLGVGVTPAGRHWADNLGALKNLNDGPAKPEPITDDSEEDEAGE